METIKKKEMVRWAIFLIISGIGALWLTFWWNKAMNGDGGGFGSPDSIIGIGITTGYYIFNSILLTLLGIMLIIKKFKTYSILSIILGFSVTASLFVINISNGFNPLANLFFLTIIEGMYFGFIYGGFILVPMFLIGVYKSLIRGIRYFRGKINYDTLN